MSQYGSERNHHYIIHDSLSQYNFSLYAYQRIQRFCKHRNFVVTYEYNSLQLKIKNRYELSNNKSKANSSTKSNRKYQCKSFLTAVTPTANN